MVVASAVVVSTTTVVVGSEKRDTVYSYKGIPGVENYP